MYCPASILPKKKDGDKEMRNNKNGKDEVFWPVIVV
jgi:hypothetical protein